VPATPLPDAAIGATVVTGRVAAGATMAVVVVVVAGNVVPVEAVVVVEAVGVVLVLLPETRAADGPAPPQPARITAARPATASERRLPLRTRGDLIGCSTFHATGPVPRAVPAKVHLAVTRT
jgi:hypothetical protein